MLSGKELKMSYLNREELIKEISLARNVLQSGAPCDEERLKDEISRKIDYLSQLQHEIEVTVESVDDAALREILELRYIYWLKWSEISASLNYSSRWTYRLHKKALEYLDENKPL